MANSTKTVLLVEDEALIALQESRQLQEAGYAVIHSLTGEGAIEMVDANPDGIDLILMDIDLGRGIDGTEAARRILRTNDIPVLFLSSHMEPDMVKKTEEITNYGYVVKSSVLAVLDASIKMALKLFSAKRQLDLDSMEIERANEELHASLENLRKTHDRLLLSEDKFSKAFHLNPDSININRLSDGAYIDINEGFTRIMGYAREDVIGRSSLPGDLGIWVHEEDRERLVQELREKGEMANLEAEFRKKDGTTTTGLMSARIIEIEGEKCIISITRDIGERQRTQNELSETERKFRSAFGNSPIGISLTSLDGQLRMINQAFCDMLGRSMIEMNAMDFTGLTHAEDLRMSVEMARRLVEGKAEKCHFRKRFLHRDGHSVWADIYMALVKDNSGNPDFYISQVVDMTERKAIEDELRLKSILLDNAGDSIEALDLEGNIVYVNEATCRHSGYKKDELVGKHITIIDTPEGKKVSKSILADVVRQGSARFRSAQVRKDGSVFPIDVNCVLEPNEKRLILSVVRDITEQERAEETYKETQAIQKSILDSQKNIFIVSIDKDFRCLYANKAYREMKSRLLGVEISIGKSLLDNLPMDTLLQKSIPVFRRVLEGESCRLALMHEPSRMIIEMAYNPIYSEKGEITGATAFGMDITDRKRMEEALEKSEERFRLAMEATTDGIWDRDVTAGKTYYSPAYYRMLGYEENEFGADGRKWIEYVHPDDRDFVLAANRDCAENRCESFNIEFRMQTKDSSWKWVNSRGRAAGRDADGKAIRIIGTHTDIADRKAIEAELRLKSFLLDNAGDSIQALDLEGNLVYVNDAVCRVTGYAKEELLGKHVGLLDAPETKPLAMKMLDETARLGTARFETTHIRKDGSNYRVEVHSVLEPTDKKLLIAVDRDITERKRIEEALMNSESGIKAIITASPDGISHESLDGTILYASPQCARILGYDDADEAVGRNILDFIDPSYHEKVKKAISDLLLEHKSQSEEYMALRQDGSAIFVEIHTEIIKGNNGKPDTLVSVIRDISERKKYEEDLNASRARYFDLLNSIGEGFCYIDENEVFRMANPSAGRIFRVEPDSLIGRSLFDFLDDEGKEIDRRETANRVDGKSTDYMTPVIRSDGEKRWLHVNASPVSKKADRYYGASVILRDITEERKATEALNQLVRNKEILMKELEHRVKNSLSVVSSLLNIATNELSDKKAIGILEDTVSRIKSMSAIYERLSLSESVDSIDFGKYLEGIVKSIFSTFSPDSSRISLIIEAEHMEIDTKRAISLGLIVNELLTNALKYAFPDDRSGTINVQLKAKEDAVCLTVSDNGIGIGDPGIPGSSPTMGMTLIRLLVEQIGASMKSDLSHGTAISIAFRP